MKPYEIRIGDIVKERDQFKRSLDFHKKRLEMLEDANVPQKIIEAERRYVSKQTRNYNVMNLVVRMYKQGFRDGMNKDFGKLRPLIKELSPNERLLVAIFGGEKDDND